MSDLEKAYMNELEWFISNELDDDWVEENDKKPLRELTEEDKRDIVDALLNDYELNQLINSSIRYYIYHIKDN
ncbi:MAG: hypothetical protein VZQ62_00475 [Methanosphaera sp.]|nr:hypothetical protein [Methanosphaera sp.]